MLTTQQQADLRLVNPLTLAFLGDSVYELLVREQIVQRYHSLSAGKLHTLAVEMVRAGAQAQAFDILEPVLTEFELAVFRRGRNAGGVTVPKHSTAADYRAATGLEALFGYLYLGGQDERIRALFTKILNGVKHDEEFGCSDQTD